MQRTGDTAHAAARQGKPNTIYLGNGFSSHLYDPVAVSCTRVEVLSLQGGFSGREGGSHAAGVRAVRAGSVFLRCQPVSSVLFVIP